MKYEIKTFEFEHTGGGIWVGFSEIRLPDTNETIWATTSDEVVALYHTKEDCNACGNEFALLWVDELPYEENPHNSLAFALVARYDKARGGDQMHTQTYIAYAPNADITFIMQDTFLANGEINKTAVVGWYYGEPDEENTKAFIGKLTATY